MLAKRFSKLTIEEMFKLTEISSNKNRELGFPLCEKENGEVSHSTELSCIGTKCHTTVSDNCGRYKNIGLFHTHPEGSIMPSFSDLRYNNQIGLLCTGVKDEQYGSVVLCNERNERRSKKEVDYVIQATEEVINSMKDDRFDKKFLGESKNKNKRDILNLHFNTIVFRKKPDSDKILYGDYKF